MLVLAGACDRPTGDSVPSDTQPPPPETAGEPASATAIPAIELIDEDTLKGYIAEISADKYGGRSPGSDGDAMARKYLADTMASFGLQPGGAGGSWEQEFELVGITAELPSTWSFMHGSNQVEFTPHDQFMAASGVQAERAGFENAEVVFVGYGINAPEYAWDDFKDIDVRGKVLLVMNNDPEWDPELFAGNTRLYYGRWSYKYENAARHGAAGVIIIHTRESAGYPWQVVDTSWAGEQFELAAGEEPRIQVAAWLTEESASELVGMAGHELQDLLESARNREFVPVPLGVTTSINFRNTIRTITTANVLGLLPGSDPGLSGEVVIYTAHHDHLGVGAPDADGDTIYNGARDNGAGVSSVLAIARAFAATPDKPRRSLLFAFVAAEEQGLLGSAFYANNPTYAPGHIAANLNFDGGNIWGKTSDITIIGLGKSSLDTIILEQAGNQGRGVKPDQLPDRGFFYRSDQFNFARIGVPAMFFRTGSEFIGKPDGWGKERIEYYEDHDYHQASDELRDDWNFDGMVEDARLGYSIGLAVANDEQMPAWNPGDEFEAARLQALSDLQE